MNARRMLILIIALTSSGCATSPYGHPYGIWEGGMRMPDDQACRISEDGRELLACGAHKQSGDGK